MMIQLVVWARLTQQHLMPLGRVGLEAGVSFFSFSYTDQWLNLPQAYPIAPAFPLSTTVYRNNQVKTFFQNLLPEGAALDAILQNLHYRDPGLLDQLNELGEDMPGVLSILPVGVEPRSDHRYQRLTTARLSQRLQERHLQRPFLSSNPRAGMSLAGAQDKLGLRYDPSSGELYDTVGTSPSTHIAKPDTRNHHFAPSALNEYLIMRLAQELKLPVPPVYLLHVPETVFVVQRYDRWPLAAGEIACLHQLDMCQVLNVGSGWKYQRDGGLVSLPRIAVELRRLALPREDMKRFRNWVVFNYLVGNTDAHAKNLSLLVDSQGYRLAPFYDLLCVQVYGETQLALYIGDDERIASVGAHSWEAFCEDCHLPYAETRKKLTQMAKAIPKLWPKLCQQVRREHPMTEAEAALVERIGAVLHQQCHSALSMVGGLGDD